MNTEKNDKLDTFIAFLKAKLGGKSASKSLQKKLEDPEKLAEQVVHDIGSDSQRISLK